MNKTFQKNFFCRQKKYAKCILSRPHQSPKKVYDFLNPILYTTASSEGYAAEGSISNASAF